MSLIYQSPFLKALGWSLVNSLWQMGILWLLYICITANSRKFSAAIRHTLALLAICGGCAWFIADLIVNIYNISYGNGLSGNGTFFMNSLGGMESMTFLLHAATPFLSLIYLAGLAFLLTRLAREFRLNGKLSHSHLQLPDDYLALFLESAAKQMGIKRKVKIWLSHLVDTPLTIGFWKPLVLLPVALFSHLTPSQAEAIIIHELHHIKRSDYLVNLLMAFADIFLFFNPFVRTLAGIVKKERENSCDDKVLQLQYNMHEYAQALLMLETKRLQQHRLTIAATGRDQRALLNRVKRMAYGKAETAPIKGKLAGCFLAILLAISAGWHGQNKVDEAGLVMTKSRSQSLALMEPALPSLVIDRKDKEEITTSAKQASGGSRRPAEIRILALHPERINANPEISSNFSSGIVKKNLKDKNRADKSKNPDFIFHPKTADKPEPRDKQEGLTAILEENQQTEPLISYASIPAPTPVLMESLNIEPGASFSPVINLDKFGNDFQVRAITPDIILVVKQTGEAFLLKIKAPVRLIKTLSPTTIISRQPVSPDTAARVRKIIHI
ncbi:MAG: M56 family metallopeptidase [Flavitalea sp.]